MREKQDESEYWDDPAQERPKSSFQIKKSIYIAILTVFLAGIGSTLAANININSGRKVEFGQGMVQATACDDSIKVTPLATFENALNKRFVVSGVDLSGVDSQAGKCADKYFEIGFYGDTGPMLGKYVIFDENSSFISGDGSISSSSLGTSNSQVKLSVTNGSIASKDVRKITVESKNIEKMTSPTISYAADIANSGNSGVKIVICFSNSHTDTYSKNICPDSSGTEMFTRVTVTLPANVIWTGSPTVPVLNESTSSGFACLPGSNFNGLISADQTRLVFEGFNCRVNPSVPEAVFALSGTVGTYGSLSTPTFISPSVTITTASGSTTSNIASNFSYSASGFRYPNGIPCMAIVAVGTHQCWETIP